MEKLIPRYQHLKGHVAMYKKPRALLNPDIDYLCNQHFAPPSKPPWIA